MKFSRNIVTFLILCSLLAACSTAEGEDAAEVFKQAEKASESLESVAMDMEMSQTVSTEGDESTGDMNIDMSASGEMQIDPLLLHQTLEVDTAMGEMAEMPAQQIEQYVTEDAMYMTNPMNGEWMKAPQAMQEQLTQSASLETQSPTKQLEMFKDHISDFSMEETEDSYKLDVSATGEEMKSLLSSVMEQSGNDMMNEEMFEKMSINRTDISFVLAKDTYYPETVDLSMDITIEEEGQTVHMTQESNITYSDYNNIGELTVPDEVMNNAEEMDVPGL
ncbi:DUF6612 family protein [Salimicrobium flavidum]|uniref:Lipoprotein n=1 Tax=Salimicrobium flavidum TaxID=570947 RepID=A0A1N7J3W1_9BACI|nr:DUF6612 family protein [Salimicrobium flavidum]SIS44055.1 hypothetical protein SAMN05421687_103330 [Salimicrobium flavidum]